MRPGPRRSKAANIALRIARALRRRATPPVQLAGLTLSNAWRDRVLGLAAEAGFWQLLSLPPLLLALLGAIGYLGETLGPDAVESIRASLLHGADDLLTPEVVDGVVRPTVDQILSRGRPDVISIGFVLSLWTGSTAMATYVNTITIAYGQRDLRSAVRSRLLALRLFLAQLVTGVIILPSLVLGPGMLAELFDADRHSLVRWLLRDLFWPVVGLLAMTMLTSLYHLSLPARRPWQRALPGALLALLCWLLGSYLLRLYLELVFGHELVYGSLGAPVAALLFFYITALAVLFGAELNAAMDQRSAPAAGLPALGEPGDPVGSDRPTVRPAPTARPGPAGQPGPAGRQSPPDRREPPQAGEAPGRPTDPPGPPRR
jgi:membrane protein